MKLVLWVAEKSTYVATFNFYFTRKRAGMTPKPWPHPESPCHDVHPAEKTFHTNFTSVLIFSILHIFCSIFVPYV